MCLMFCQFLCLSVETVSYLNKELQLIEVELLPDYQNHSLNLFKKKSKAQIQRWWWGGNSQIE